MTINISEELPARKNAPAVAAKSSAKKGDAKGGTPQENSAKRIRQAVYDIRYRARREDIDLRKAYSEYMANSNLSAQEKTAVREKLFGKQGGGVSEQYMVTSVDWAEKNFADAYHKVFVEGIKKEEPAIELAYEQELAEEPERKYKVRVFDPKSEKSYVRFATREKISKLRAKGLKVEMTEHGEAYEGERKKGEQTAAAMGGGKKNVNEDAFDPNFVDRKRKEQDRPKDKKQQAPADASGGPITNRIGPGTSGGPTLIVWDQEPVVVRITNSIKAKPLATLNRGKKGDGFLGPTISAGGVRIGIPNLSPIRREALDPVGQEDGDVNNDGKKDKTDKYLMNRRKAVGKAIAAKKGKKVDEAFLADGATGTTSTEGQNAREIDVLPEKVAKKLQQVTVMPQDGTNPQVGKAPLMMSQQMEGEQLTEEEEDRRERYAFMNVARNLVRAKTGAKRPIAMDPEGTYKKAKEDLAKMVNSGNPDKDKEETPCEEAQLDYANDIMLAGMKGDVHAHNMNRDTIPPDVKKEEQQKRLTRKESMADVFMSIANAPKEDSEQLDEFLGPQAAKNVETLLNRGRKVFDQLGIPNNRTPRPTVTKDQQQEKIKKNVK